MRAFVGSFKNKSEKKFQAGDIHKMVWAHPVALRLHTGSFKDHISVQRVEEFRANTTKE